MKIATVTRLTRDPAGAGWNQPPWCTIAPELLLHHMGVPPVHFPETAVKIGYDEIALHVAFQVKDQYVRATATRHQGDVCGDSCVEFFFTPGPNPKAGYFNLEINCGGTMLFHYHPDSLREQTEFSATDCDEIAINCSLPHRIDPERAEPVTWTVSCSIPYTLLERYCPIDRPGPQIIWRANFYKCADNTSHPHWLTWAAVDHPRPNFHLPRFFGALHFLGGPPALDLNRKRT